MSAQPRTVDRGLNPFAPIAKQQNQALSPLDDIYENLADRVNHALESSETGPAEVEQSLAALTQRLGGQKFRQEHFGRLELVPFSLIDINIDIQRDLALKHIATNIIQHFDPRIVQPVNVTYIRSTGRYSAWDGQQSSAALLLIYQAGLIDGDFAVQCKVFDDDLQVPGSSLQGEAVGNYGFRTLNGKGREPIDVYFMHRSRVNGVRLYGSQLEQDKQSEEIQQILEANHMFPAKMSEARGRQARPGMVTHLSAVNNIAGHDTQRALFNVTKQDLDRALSWHDRYYASEKGVDGGFILAFGRLYAEAREQNITITAETEEGLYHLFQSHYGSPSGFHDDCKQRLQAFQKKNHLKESWSDSCLTPILVSDYVTAGGPGRLPRVDNMVTYAGV